MDGHQYLHYDSCHGDHMKMPIIFNQTLRLKRMCSQNNYLPGRIEYIKILFHNWGYPDNFIKEQVEKALRLTLSDENNQKVSGVPLVTMYNPAFKNLSQVLQKAFNYMQTNRLRKCFHLPHLFPSEAQET